MSLQKKYKLKNIDDLLLDENLFDDEDIIVELDGDDWLENNNVLSLIDEKYKQNKNCSFNLIKFWFFYLIVCL